MRYDYTNDNLTIIDCYFTINFILGNLRFDPDRFFSVLVCVSFFSGCPFVLIYSTNKTFKFILIILRLNNYTTSSKCYMQKNKQKTLKSYYL